MKMNVLIVCFLFSFSLCCSKEPAQETKNTVRYVNAANGLTLRDQPLQNGKALALLPSGTEVKIIEESADEQTIGGITAVWAKVTFQGNTGWLFAGYLQNSQNSGHSGNADSSFTGTWDDCLVLQVDHGVYLHIVLDASGAARLGEAHNRATGTWTFDAPKLKIESPTASMTIVVESKTPNKFCGSISGSGDVTVYSNSVQSGTICFCK